jgi:flagellar biosynthesis protein FlhF
MKLRKFFGLTSRSVLDQIRTELGADAVIVANHPTPQGVEISALTGDAMDTILGEIPTPVRRSRSIESRPAPPAVPEPPAPGMSDEVTPEVAASTGPSKIADTGGDAPRDLGLRSAESTWTARLMTELAAMRALLEGQVAQLAWSDSVRRKPLRAQLTQELMLFGYSPALAREVTQRLPDDYTSAQAQQWLLGVIARNVRCVEPADDIVTRGGVYALVGPTGVGKTTTTAKLAARCAVRHGSASLALLTTDSYRVGAQDQLRIYAKILGVSVQTVNDARDLRPALDSLRSKHLVLIDTVGMGQRDMRVAEHALMLAQPEVRRLLLLNAASQAETLEEVVAAYGAGDTDAERGIDGCIITKQDESARPGQVLDVIIRHRLQVHYIANGQRVPEDLQPANGNYLAHRSFRPLPKTSPFHLQTDEVPLMLSAAGAAHA